MTKEPHCRMEYTRDASGQEVLLKDGKFQVMMEWERPYMQACIDALKPSGAVLEIGFGCGYSSTQIQKYQPKSHTIIEFHPVVVEKARHWAKQHPGVTIIEDTWQNALSTLGVFDAIFFDDYPLESEEEMNRLVEEQQKSSEHLHAGEALLRDVLKQIPHLQAMKYSQADLDAFFHEIEKEKWEGKHLFRFLTELQTRGQISQELFDQSLQTLLKRGWVQESDCAKIECKPPAQSKARDRLFQFLSTCLKNHMRAGSRFSCFLSDSTSKYEDAVFLETFILDPFLDYHEEQIPIIVPPTCTYYHSTHALVITLTKR